MKKIAFIIIAMVLVLSSFAFAAQLRDKPEKITFIHYKDGKVKAVASAAKPTTTICYALLGAKWTTLPVNYSINPTNLNGLSEEFITSAISASAEEWDIHTGKELFDNVYTIDYTADYDGHELDNPDYKNEYSFGPYSDSNVIAVTNIWGFFSGSKSQRRIVEYDILFNSAYTWGDASNNTEVMDLQNIATHETGHGIGLGDLYASTCSQETMYGYGSAGETSKRDLNLGDIAGLQKMYGR